MKKRVSTPCIIIIVDNNNNHSNNNNGDDNNNIQTIQTIFRAYSIFSSSFFYEMWNKWKQLRLSQDQARDSIVYNKHSDMITCTATSNNINIFRIIRL